MSVRTFSFGHCIVCLFVHFPLVIVLSVFSYLFLWSLFCLSFRIFSFGHCIICFFIPFPYGCNDNIKGVGNLSSPGCSEINVMSLFNTIPRTKRSHGHKRIQHPNVKKAFKPRTLQDTFNDLLSNIQKPLGIHHIRTIKVITKLPNSEQSYKGKVKTHNYINRQNQSTILFSLPVNYLKDLRDFGLDKGGVVPFSPKYRLSSIICDVASFRLFKPVRSEPLHENNRKFLHIPFANKGIDANNISNILNRKEVVKEIPPYFKNQSVPIVSYSYTNSIGRKSFNYKEALQDINIEEYLKNPLTCDCSHSLFQYNPSGHAINGDRNIIQHESLRKMISHGPKFREPQHINWKHNFKIIMDAVEDFARRWIKREVDQDPELES